MTSGDQRPDYTPKVTKDEIEIKPRKSSETKPKRISDRSPRKSKSQDSPTFERTSQYEGSAKRRKNGGIDWEEYKKLKEREKRKGRGKDKDIHSSFEGKVDDEDRSLA